MWAMKEILTKRTRPREIPWILSAFLLIDLTAGLKIEDKLGFCDQVFVQSDPACISSEPASMYKRSSGKEVGENEKWDSDGHMTYRFGDKSDHIFLDSRSRKRFP